MGEDDKRSFVFLSFLHRYKFHAAKEMAALILDCTLRDGGYVNNWKFSEKQVQECYLANAAAGVDYMEIGFRNKETPDALLLYGDTYFCREDYLNRVLPPSSGDAPELAVMVTVNQFSLDDFVPRKDSRISMVRVLMAYHGIKNETDDTIDEKTLEDGIQQIRALADLGYKVTFNLGRIDKLMPEQLITICERVGAAPVSFFYMADTYGTVDTMMIESLVPFIRERIPSTIGLGFHAHNHCGDATAKALHSVRFGVDLIDGCALGYGRGPGNARTEGLMMGLNRNHETRYDYVPVVEFGLQHLIYFYGIVQDPNMSYNPIYAACAHLGCHVTYGIEIMEKFSPHTPFRRLHAALVEIRKDQRHMFYYKGLLAEKLDQQQKK